MSFIFEKNLLRPRLTHLAIFNFLSIFWVHESAEVHWIVSKIYWRNKSCFINAFQDNFKWRKAYVLLTAFTKCLKYFFLFISRQFVPGLSTVLNLMVQFLSKINQYASVCNMGLEPGSYLNTPFPASYFFIFVFSIPLTVNKCAKKICQWLDLNHGPLESDVTILPTESPPLPWLR